MPGISHVPPEKKKTAVGEAAFSPACAIGAFIGLHGLNPISKHPDSALL
jgi:hypothetical protein